MCHVRLFLVIVVVVVGCDDIDGNLPHFNFPSLAFRFVEFNFFGVKKICNLMRTQIGSFKTIERQCHKHQALSTQDARAIKAIDSALV